MSFQESKTYANLLAALDKERISSTQLEINSEQARREGFIEISNIFHTTSNQQRAHAVIWLRMLNEGKLPMTKENLENTVRSESDLGNNTYREYARIAKEEGYDEIAAVFNGVANIELIYELEFRNILDDLESDKVFCKDQEVLWICINCGNVLSGKCAPEICPVCYYPQGYYKVYSNLNM